MAKNEAIWIKTEDGTMKEIEGEPDRGALEYEGEQYYQCDIWKSKGVDTYFHWEHMDEDGEICLEWRIDMSKMPNFNLWIYAWTMGNYKEIDDVLDRAHSEVDKLNKEEFNKWVDEHKERFPGLTRYTE
jgi:hypothetical protein|tara:strand:+ start:2086 stop:2472 length:387 start_codon:yes stop_codon:yes gene_type:complete